MQGSPWLSCLSLVLTCPVYFQAYVVGSDRTTGLIPSRYLEEKRKAFVPKENLYSDQGKIKDWIQYLYNLYLSSGKKNTFPCTPWVSFW